MIDRKTNWGTPWALVRWNGQAEGQAPKTKMAFLNRAVAVDGEITHFIGYTIGAKTYRKFRPSDIIKQWRHAPNKKAIARVKAGLRNAARAEARGQES
jgi:hypothetical protein